MADPSPVVRVGLATIFSREADIQVIGQAASGQETFDLFASLMPDMLVMEMEMPDMAGEELIAALTNCFPAACILVFSHNAEEKRIYGALGAGANAYYFKEAEGKALVESVRFAWNRHKALAAHLKKGQGTMRAAPFITKPPALKLENAR